MRKYVMPQSPTVNYMLYDHLGSTNITTDTNGAVVTGLRYRAWGEVRYPTNGTNPGPSKYTYTGQYSNVDDFGLMFYNARWYDSVIGRFTQPDTIIPEQGQGTQAWDRYAYASNNPISYNDPSGHFGCKLGERCLMSTPKSTPTNPTGTPTYIPTPTATPSPTVTNTPTATATATPAYTPTASVTPTVNSPTPTKTATSTAISTPHNANMIATPTESLSDSIQEDAAELVDEALSFYDLTEDPGGPFVGTGFDPLSPLESPDPRIQAAVETTRLILTVAGTGRSVLRWAWSKLDPFSHQPTSPYDEVYPPNYEINPLPEDDL